MIHLLTIVGARPQFIKASAVSRAVRERFGQRIREKILHTGQHYDANMSDVFFSEMGIPKPDYKLDAGTMQRHEQISFIVKNAGDIMKNDMPDLVLVYGDTNSTLAGALAAASLQVPVAHVEAGLRSYNKSMPEETNRVLTDHLSTWLFCPTPVSMANLGREGFDTQRVTGFTADTPGCFLCGDVMFDNTLYFSSLAGKRFTGQVENVPVPEDFVLVTIHRENNTTELWRLENIFGAVCRYADDYRVDFMIPLHPRTIKALESKLPALHAKMISNPRIRLLPPLSYLDMTVLESRSRFIITDSGGVQKEAAFHGKKCVVLRSETEWTELQDAGIVDVVDMDMEAVTPYLESPGRCSVRLPSGLYGSGDAAGEICRILCS